MHKTSITFTNTVNMKSHNETVTDKQTSVSLPVFVNLLQNDNLHVFNVSSNEQIPVNCCMSQQCFH